MLSKEYHKGWNAFKTNQPYKPTSYDWWVGWTDCALDRKWWTGTPFTYRPYEMIKNPQDYTLKELVTKTIVHFVEYRKGYLYYNISGYENFVFPVPIEDTGDATFKSSDTGIYFMRYIRKHLETLANA